MKLGDIKAPVDSYMDRVQAMALNSIIPNLGSPIIILLTAHLHPFCEFLVYILDLDLCVCTHFQIWILFFLVFESSSYIKDNNLVTVKYWIYCKYITNICFWS